MAELKIVGYDTEIDGIADATKALLNSFPVLGANEILYQTLGKSSGLAFYNTDGALIMSERRSVNGNVYQRCQFSFIIVSRRSAEDEGDKLSAHMFLSLLGKWICRESVTWNGEELEKAVYPLLTGNRKIRKIRRGTPYSAKTQQDGVTDWCMHVTIEYENRYKDL